MKTKEELNELDRKYTLHPFTQLKKALEEGPRFIVEGNKTRVKDIDGNEYLDAFSSMWNVSIGHGQKPVIDAIKTALPRYQRDIDEDHYGAGFAFRFGDPNEPIVQRNDAMLSKRLNKDPGRLRAVGGTEEIMALLADFHAAGVHKFVLRPIATDSQDLMHQTQRLIDEVLPEVKALNPATTGTERATARGG